MRPPLLLLLLVLLGVVAWTHAFFPHPCRPSSSSSSSSTVRRRGGGLAITTTPVTRLYLWKGWGLGGNNATASSGQQQQSSDEEDDEEDDDEGDSVSLLGEAGADEDAIIIEGVDDEESDDEEEVDDVGQAVEALMKAAVASMTGEDELPPAVGAAAPGAAVPTSSKPMLTEKATQQQLQDDSSSFDGFEGFRGKRVSYSSQPKARHNIVFEIWRQRTPEDIAILYKGQHQYSASRRVQEAINEQVSTLLGMFLREPDFQSRLQIQGGQLANLFFKLQMMGYMFANADKILSASSSLNLRDASRKPPIGGLSGSLTVLQGPANAMGSGGDVGGPDGVLKNVTLGAKEMLGSLVREVEALREELNRAKMTREVTRQSDLLAFIRGLPEEQQRVLTENIPDYTLDCMRKLVDLALARAIPTVGNQWNPTTPVLIPSKAIFAELCIMQVVQGYLLSATEEDQAHQLKLFGGGGGIGFP